MPVFRSLLVPIDDSDTANAAAGLAIQLAADQKATILFLNVVESDKIIASVIPGQGYTDPEPAIDAVRAAGTQMLDDAVSAAKSQGVQASSELTEGDSIETIVDRAQASNASLIVMGSHGRGGVQRLLLGSVAEGVLRHSQIPVLIAKASKA